MGNDGGSIPKRRELVKEAARNPTAAELKSTILEHQDHLWHTDPLSQRPLAVPVVSDALGRLFTKDSVLEFLLPLADDSTAGVARRSEQEALLQGAVKSLKDVVEIKLEIDDAATEATKRRQGTGGNRRAQVWVCPVTRAELGPDTKAVYLVPCGHAFSAAAIKEVSGEHCLQCNTAYAANDVIPILPTADTDVARLALRVKTLREKGLAHSLKKLGGAGKKRKQDIVQDAATVVPEMDAGEKLNSASVSAHTPALENGHLDSRPASKSGNPLAAQIQAPPPRSGTNTPKGSSSTGIKNASTASLTAKVLEEQEARNKRRKVEENKNLQTLYTSKSDKKHRDIDFMNRGFSIT